MTMDESPITTSGVASPRTSPKQGRRSSHAGRVLGIILVLVALAVAIGVTAHALGERGAAGSLSGTMTLSGDMKGDGSSATIRFAAAGDTLTLSSPGHDGSLKIQPKAKVESGRRIAIEG